MNKFFAIATATVVVACVAVGLYVFTPEEKLPEKQVQIVDGKIEPGMTARNVAVDVRMDNEPVDCRVQLTGFTWDGQWEMADDEPVAQDFCVRLDVFYSLPKGYDVDNIHVNMVCMDQGDRFGSQANLQQIVAKYDFAQYNGQYYTVSGLPPDHGAKLDIQYDSGESICSANNQSCFIPLEAMEELVSLF